jgi:hypothetical protein
VVRGFAFLDKNKADRIAFSGRLCV